MDALWGSMMQAVVAKAEILLVLRKTQSIGFNFLFARLKILAAGRNTCVVELRNSR